MSRGCTLCKRVGNPKGDNRCLVCGYSGNEIEKLEKREGSKKMKDLISDCLVCITGIKPTDGIVLAFWTLLPREISVLASEWGEHDTVVRDRTYRWLSITFKAVREAEANNETV